MLWKFSLKKAPNAFDAETGEMTLEEAPEGEENI